MRIVREAVKDKSYQETRLGREVGRYLNAKAKSAAPRTIEAYESTLAKFASHFGDLEVAKFEPPAGTELVEEWLDAEWGRHEPTTYNRHLAPVRDFFRFQVERQRMVGNPTSVIKPAKKRELYRTVFTPDQVRAILASQDNARDRIALRLLLHYGLRRGALQAIQFKHFDHLRQRLTVFLKGGKVRSLPIPEPAFWDELGRHIIEAEARPDHFLMTARWRNRYGEKDRPEQPMSAHGLHSWWYAALARAGIVPTGVTSGERMHKARHTAGQMVLDKTGNLAAVQSLLMHESIQTTGDTYVDWDVERLAVTLADVFAEEGE
jgi:site-specific recombinase XerD